jgi:hypothetical protein
MKTLYQYFAIFLLDLFLLYIFIPVMILSFINNDILLLIISSIVVATDLNELITRHRNFVLYYPNFEDKWLKIF